MPTTKIINILKNDKLDDILDIFNRTPAQEVILVLPKKSQAFLSEDSFAVLADASRESGKNILILSESQEMNILAAKYDFGILQSEKRERKSHKTATQPVEENEVQEEFTAEAGLELQPEFQPQPESERETDFSSDAMPETILAAASKPPKSMGDILYSDPDDSIKVKINKNTERPTRIEIKKPSPKIQSNRSFTEKMAIDEIQNIWQRREPAQKKESRSFLSGSIFSSLLRTKRTFLLYGLGVISIFIFVLYVSLGKADIIIKPRPYSLDFTVKVTASSEFTAIDPVLKRIPGQLLSVDKKVEEAFPATGEKDVVQKARGKITVFNEYGTTPQVLIATTRFESESGFIFRTLKTITVPGTTVKNGQITPGFVEVEVIADKAGNGYNIGSGKFTIPAFKEKGDADRYGKFYGRSSEAMKGGIVGKAKVVTEQDYINAKNKVQEKIVSEAEQELKNKASGLEILSLPESDTKEVISSAQIDEAADSFSVSGTARLSTVGFKKSDLDSFLASYIQGLNDVSVVPEKLELNFGTNKFNEKDKTLEFSIAVKGFVYGKVDKDKIITDLMGKGENDIKEYIKTIDTIASVKVVLSPFWIWKVPKDKSRIYLKMEY